MTTKTQWADDKIDAVLSASGEAVKPRVGTYESREFTRLYVKASPKTRRQMCHIVFAFDARQRGRWASWLYHWLAFLAVNPSAAMKASQSHRRFVRFVALALTVAAVLLLAGCGGEGGGGVRATAEALGTRFPSAQTPAEVTREATVVVEATRIVNQPVEVTREVVVVVTATPDVAGFDVPAIDESVQPCPVGYWRNGRCVANDAQIEHAAQDVSK